MFNYVNASGTDLRYGKLIGHALLAIVIIIGLFGSVGMVSAGERGVKTRLGAVQGIVSQGAYAKIPFIEKVVKMDVRTQSFSSTPDQPLMAASNDLQDTRLAVVVNYHIDPTTVQDIYVQYGSADKYYAQVVEPLIISTIKAVASQYTAADQIQKRAEMTAAVQTALLASFEGKNVYIEKTDITNIAFSEAFTQAIETKVTAVQNAEAAKNKLEQVKYEAEQTVVAARGVAEAQTIKAAALQSQGGRALVDLTLAEKWNGVLPTTMVPGSSVPFINVQH